MARSPIEIALASETKAFKQGIETGVIQPLEDAIKELRKLGDADGADKLEASLRDAQRATEKLGDETKITAAKIEREYRDSYRKAERAADDFSTGTSENMRNAADEGIQNFSEMASSFNGDLADMADGVQGFTGGLASALTPGIGIPLAVLGAVAASWLANWQQATEEAKERVDSMYDDMLESGSRYLSDDFINTRIAEIGKEQWDLVQQRVKETGATTQEVLRAMAGDEHAIADILGEQGAKHRENLELLQSQQDGSAGRANQIDAENTKYEAQTEWLRQIQDETDTAASKASTIGRAMKQSGDEGVDAANRIGAAVNGIQDKTIRVKLDTSAWDNWTPQQKVAYLQAQPRGAREIQ